MATECVYEVVRPMAKSRIKQIIPARPLTALDNKKIALIWTIFSNGDVLADALINEMIQRYKGVGMVKLPAGKKVKWGEYPDESIEDVVKEARVDAAIVLVGG